MGREKEVKKAYSWDHKAKDVERVNDVGFERVQSNNDRLRIVVEGKAFRFDRTDINSYHGIYLGDGKYACCFDMDFDVDEEKLREFTIDAFIKANENKIHALYDSIRFEVRKHEKKMLYWEVIKERLDFPTHFWEDDFTIESIRELNDTDKENDNG